MTEQEFPSEKKIFNAAKAFHDSMEMLINAISESRNTQKRTPPETVCLMTNYCLAAELFLKALLTKEGKTPHGHDLLALFNDLSAEAQERLKTHTVTYEANIGGEIKPFDIAQVMKQHKDGFKIYRYFYEPKNSAATPKSINAIRTACLSLCAVSRRIIFP